MFSCNFYILFVGFQSIHAFLIYFSKIFTRLLFAPFPLVCCISMYLSKSFIRLLDFSDRFCTISSGCYRIFLHFHCLFPTCLLHRHSLFLALTPVSSMFQQILHGLFLAFSSDRYHVFLKFHCIFQYILFVGFSICFVQHFFTTCFLSFSPLSSIGVCTISSGFLHFHTFSILILIQEFYLTPSFSDPFCTLSSRCYHIFLHFHCIFSSMFTASSWFAPSIRSGFLHFPRDFPWFVPSIRSVIRPFSRGFCTISSDRYHVFLQFHCIFQYILMVSPATKKRT